MKVRATAMGFYEHARRREGDVFVIPDEPRAKPKEVDAKHHERGPILASIVDRDGTVPQAFSARWMEPVDASTPEAVTTAQKALDKATDVIRQEKAGEKAAEKSAADVI